MHRMLGERLRHYRLERNWTQIEAAERAGTNQSAISRIERGVADRMLAEPLIRYAALFGLTPNDVAREMGWWDGPTHNPFLQELGALLAVLEAEDRSQLENTLLTIAKVTLATRKRVVQEKTIPPEVGKPC